MTKNILFNIVTRDYYLAFRLAQIILGKTYNCNFDIYVSQSFTLFNLATGI